MSAPRSRLYGHRGLSDEGVHAEVLRTPRLRQYLQPNSSSGAELPGLAPRGSWRRRQLRLALIGGSAHSGYLASMRALAVRLGVDRLLDWVGFVHPTQLMDWYKHRCMDVVVAPYLRPLSESFGLVLTEAMEAGLPVLHFAVGGIQDYARPKVLGGRSNEVGDRSLQTTAVDAHGSGALSDGAKAVVSAASRRHGDASGNYAFGSGSSRSSSSSGNYAFNSFVAAERSGASLGRALLEIAADARTRRRVAHEAARFVRSTLQRDNVAPPLEVTLRNEAVAARLAVAHLPGGFRELAFAGATCPASASAAAPAQADAAAQHMQPAVTWADLLQLPPTSFSDAVACRSLRLPLAADAAVEPLMRSQLSGTIEPAAAPAPSTTGSSAQAAGGAAAVAAMLNLQLRATLALRRVPPSPAAAAVQPRIDAMLQDFAAKVGMGHRTGSHARGAHGDVDVASRGSAAAAGGQANISHLLESGHSAADIAGLQLSEALAPGFPDVLCGLAPTAKHAAFYRLDGAVRDDRLQGADGDTGSSLCSIETVRRRAGALVRDRLLRTARLCWAVDLPRVGAQAGQQPLRQQREWASDLSGGAAGAAGGCSYLMDIGPSAVKVAVVGEQAGAGAGASAGATGSVEHGIPSEIDAVQIDVRFQLPLSQREAASLAADPAAAVLFALTDNRLPHPVLAASACTLGRGA